MVVEVCRIESLSPERGRLVRAGDRELAVFLVDGKVHVVDNRCEHAGGSLADGPLVDRCVICPSHGWVYDLRTGEALVGSRDANGVRAYQAWVEDGVVKLELD